MNRKPYIGITGFMSLKEMSLSKLRQEVMRLRNFIRKEVNSTGNERC